MTRAEINDEMGYDFFPTRSEFMQFLLKFKEKEGIGAYQKLFSNDLKAEELHKKYGIFAKGYQTEIFNEENVKAIFEDEYGLDEFCKNTIDNLNEREKNIMELRFGFRCGEEKTQKEVADMLGISQSYISRLEKKILEKLKKEMSKLA